MTSIRSLALLSFLALGGAAFGSDATSPLNFGDLHVTYTAADAALGGVSDPAIMPARQVAAAAAAAALFIRPKIGLRIGVGQYDKTVFHAGADVTFSVPVLPLPVLRVDGEVWTGSNDIHGNAVSILEIQPILLGYVGVGPTYYYADDGGNHHSGFGAKILGGLNIPGGAFVEAGLLIGPSPLPVFVDVGWHF